MNQLIKNTTLIILIVLTISCQENKEFDKFTENVNIKSNQFEYYNKEDNNNKNRNKITKNLAEALNNGDFRNYLYEEAQKQIDGDFNVYLRKIFEDYKNENFQFKEEVESILLISKKNPNKDLAQIEKDDPNLTISIPINFDKWNPDTQIPNVYYLPNKFDEKELKFLKGYDNQGKKIKIDANDPPQDPVIVLRKSESVPDDFDYKGQKTNDALRTEISSRSITKEPILLDPIECEYESVPGKIESGSATLSGNYLQLNWTAASNAVSYRIYKYSDYTASYSFIGNTESTYFNYSPSINDAVSYYKIEAYNCKGISFIGISTDHCLPEIPMATAVTPKPTGIEVQWNKVDNASGYHLDYWADGEANRRRKTINSGNTLSGTITGYSSGQHINIKLSAFNQCGRLESSKLIGTYYSKRSSDKFFTLDHIKYKNKVEPWYLGDLDWRIHLVLQSENNPDTRTYDEQFEFKTTNYNDWGFGDNNDIVTAEVNKKFFQWKAEDDGYICVFGIVEYDYKASEGNSELNLAAKVKLTGTKDTKWGSAEGTVTADWAGTIKFSNIEDEVWDPNYMYHWEDPEKTYTFSERNHSKGEIDVKFTESY
ncbi:hypothetical protein QYS49_35580 [Marivirga salinae]|uniref:Fibronectin type-III domain-containing protein n=1 Tax=Marivirga salinarum TaxID=3059078 RepID=A0AA51NBM7_9BACT|nr:hypothetical protein [Marivirga sp. BDSF4-3]WMN10660.1 hypothetical protein QYS49_35580 [Marivirga sp. BDSF4-3]